MPKPDYCYTLTTTTTTGKVITPRNRLHSTARPKPSTLVHICIIISTFSFSVLLKIIAEFMTLVTGDQQLSPLWTFHRDEEQIQAAFLATPICVLHPWLLIFWWRTAGPCAQWKCQLLIEARGAACGVLEEVRKCYANLSLLTQQLRYECNKEKQTAREPAHVRYATKGSFQRNHFCSLFPQIPVHELEDSNQVTRHIQYEQGKYVLATLHARHSLTLPVPLKSLSQLLSQPVLSFQLLKERNHHGNGARDPFMPLYHMRQ